MTYLEWIIRAEKITILEYNRLPNFIKEKIRANYSEYCEIYQLQPQKVRI